MKKAKISAPKIEVVQITTIKQNPKNPRKISKGQLDKLAKSLTEFPEMLHLRPLIVDKKNIIIGGNMRYQAAKKIGMTSVPIIRANLLTPEQVKEFIIKDNLEFGQWDWDILTEWDSVDLEKWSLDTTNKLINDPADEDSYDPPDVVSTTIKAGDIIEIGRHRLLCGSSEDSKSLEKLFRGERYSMVFTDPPYGVSIGDKNKMLNSFQPSGRNLRDIKSDKLGADDLKKILLPCFKNLKEFASEDCTFFVTAPQGGGIGMMMMMTMMEAGLEVRHVLIWKKSSPTFSMGRLDYDYAHEPIFMTWGKKHNFYGHGEHKSSVWEVAKPRSSKEHPTMKPIALISNAILNHTLKDDLLEQCVVFCRLYVSAFECIWKRVLKCILEFSE